MNYSNSMTRLRTANQPAPQPAPQPAAPESVLSLETDSRGVHLRVRKSSTRIASALRPILAAAFGLALAASANAWFSQPAEATSKETSIYEHVPGSLDSNIYASSADSGADFGSLIQFDLSGYVFPPAEITNAIITLYATAGSAGKVSMYPILSDWREYETAPGTAPQATWEAVNGTFPTITVDTTEVTSQTVTGAGFYSFDVTSLVQGWLADPSSNFGVYLHGTSVEAFVTFADPDSNPGIAGSAPSITVVPEPGSIMALVGGAGLLLGFQRRRSMLSTA